MDAAERLQEWKERLARAAESAGRDPAGVRLLPASKTVPAERLREFFDAGQTVFGENRVQEAKAKVGILPASCRWHFIGGLQRNKVRDAVEMFELIHSVDAAALAEEIEKRAAAAGKVQRVLLEVNLAGEASKHGCRPEEVPGLLETANRLPHVEVHGLMTVPPVTEDPEDARPYFRRLRELRDRLEQASGAALPELSMGMTHDHAQAVAEGATLVRVGTGLFGKRG